jgi:stage II sporulation protein D
MDEPILAVGLLESVETAELVLDGSYEVLADSRPPRTVEGCLRLEVTADGPGLSLQCADDDFFAYGERVELRPVDGTSSFVLRGMTVGVKFHWEHTEDLRFRGAAVLVARHGLVNVINRVPLEEYLVSVISSEMSASCPPALLRAHAVISRSWLVAQLQGKGEASEPPPWMEPPEPAAGDRVRIWRWYDREDHDEFDVCADDHCQRYQGITRAFSDEATAAVEATRGLVLTGDGGVCDARFSKCCGGITELFSSAWGDEDPTYLQAFVDADDDAGLALPLADEAAVEALIDDPPEVFCNTSDAELLSRLLPGIDHGTADFFRWQVALEQGELRELVADKSGLDPGPVRAMRALRRGPSGRLVELEILGERHELVIGKELEIRRLLSSTHLYSSAFVVRPEGEADGVPERFVLHGAGWGHGVGLCQIGAAVMADRGRSHQQILTHYYRGAELESLYR